MILSSEIRLFLSVDISGSTILKSIYNHSTLLSKYKSRRASADLVKILFPNISGEQVDSILYKGLKDECSDWAAVIEEHFHGFHQMFEKKLKEYKLPKGLSFDSKNILPWKSIGDELIYSIKLNNAGSLHVFLYNFISAIEEYNSRLKQGNQIGMKGTAWTAGFPVRNRIINIPGNQKDYLGPDMDIGFKLKSCVKAGFVVVCMNIVDLVGRFETTNQIYIKHVGWDVLKDVWKGKPYPIFWASHSKDIHRNENNCGETFISKFTEKWLDEASLQEAKHFKEQIDQIRVNLPYDLGEVTPYIFDEEKKRPDDHELILQILAKLDDLNKTYEDDKPSDKEKVDKIVKDITDKIEKNIEIESISPDPDNKQ